jgi:hypothetical protein
VPQDFFVALMFQSFEVIFHKDCYENYNLWCAMQVHMYVEGEDLYGFHPLTVLNFYIKCCKFCHVFLRIILDKFDYYSKLWRHNRVMRFTKYI